MLAGMNDQMIASSRLVMAPHTIADFADLAALYVDPGIVRLPGGVPGNEETIGRGRNPIRLP